MQRVPSESPGPAEKQRLDLQNASCHPVLQARGEWIVGRAGDVPVNIK